MIFFALHVVGYSAAGWRVAKFVPQVHRWRTSRTCEARLVRITRLEVALGLGIDWATDRLDVFKPIVTTRPYGNYSMLKEKVFRCHGCETLVPFDGCGKEAGEYRGVRDDKRLFCNDCLPAKVLA